LRIKFYKIIAIRFKNRFGEIDIIAVKANSLIFIEVKARSKKLTLDEVFSSRQSLRIKSGAEFFLSKHNNFANYNYRYDLITVNKLGFCSHYKNFWQ
jgi:putative endonuclease